MFHVERSGVDGPRPGVVHWQGMRLRDKAETTLGNVEVSALNINRASNSVYNSAMDIGFYVGIIGPLLVGYICLKIIKELSS